MIAPLDLARGLLRADQDDAERAAALGDVEQDLLDRASTLARRVLVELVEHDEQQRPRACPTRSLSSNALRRVTPTTNRLARSWRLWRSTTVTCASDVRRGARGGAATSARTRRPSGALRRQQPADERVDRAHADGAARPSRPRSSSSLDPVDDEVDELVDTCASVVAVDRATRRRRRRGSPSRLQPAATLWTTIVYCWRSSSASANTNGSSSSLAELRDRPEEARDARSCGSRRRAPALRVAAPRRRVDTPTLANGAGRQAERRVALAPARRRARCWRGRGRAGPRPSR